MSKWQLNLFFNVAFVDGANFNHGLKIHQDRIKCLKSANQGPRIDRILSRRRLNQSDESQRQEQTHSPQTISTQREEEEVDVLGRTISLRHNLVHLKIENMQGRKPLVKWPKSNSKEWETIDTDLSLSQIRSKDPLKTNWKR